DIRREAAPGSEIEIDVTENRIAVDLRLVAGRSDGAGIIGTPTVIGGEVGAKPLFLKAAAETAKNGIADFVVDRVRRDVARRAAKSLEAVAEIAAQIPAGKKFIDLQRPDGCGRRQSWVTGHIGGLRAHGKNQ